MLISVSNVLNSVSGMLNGYSTPNANFVINHLPLCRSKHVKASFVFVTQFKIFWMKTLDAWDCSIDCQTINTVKAQKSMKDIVRIVRLPSVVQP